MKKWIKQDAKDTLDAIYQAYYKSIHAAGYFDLSFTDLRIELVSLFRQEEVHEDIVKVLDKMRNLLPSEPLPLEQEDSG